MSLYDEDDPTRPASDTTKKKQSTDPTRDLNALVPEVADSARSLMAAATAAGIKLTPIETRRSQARQDSLYQIGRDGPDDKRSKVTWTLNSNHTPGAAIDFLANGDMSGADPGYKWLQANAGKFGFGVPLPDRDPGHVEMPGAVQPKALPVAQAPTPIPNYNPHQPARAEPIPNYDPSRPAQMQNLATPPVPAKAAFVAQEPPVLPGKQPFYAQEPPVMPVGRLAARPAPAPAPVRVAQAPPVRQAPPVPAVATGPSADDMEADLAKIRETPAPTAPAGHDMEADLAQIRAQQPHHAIDIPDGTTVEQRPAGVGMKVLGTLGALGRDIPGVEAAQAGVRSVGRTLANKVGLPVEAENYQQALANIHGLEDAAPKAATIPARLAGGTVAAMALPGGPAMQGARYGILSGLLNSDPNSDLKNRIDQAGVQGTVGAIAGKAADLGGTAIRAKFAPDRATAINQLVKDRAADSGPLFKDFRALGDLGRTPKLDALLGDGAQQPGLPAIQRAIAAVKSDSPRLAGLPDTDAQVLDAAYKRVGNRAFAALHGFEPGEARDAFKAAIEDAAQAKGGSYENALTAYREPSQEISAINRGRKVLETATSPSGGSDKAVQEYGQPAFKDWMANPNIRPEEKQRAIQGLLGQVNQRGAVKGIKVLGTPVIPWPTTALSKGSEILNQVSPTQALLRSLGVAAANDPLQP